MKHKKVYFSLIVIQDWKTNEIEFLTIAGNSADDILRILCKNNYHILCKPYKISEAAYNSSPVNTRIYEGN